MNNLEQFYQSSFLTPFTKDRCIHCHRNDAIQLIVQMEIDGPAEQGPFCRTCYLDSVAFFKFCGK